ncbi:hypothetical protein RCS94_01025 [Orbaceae bacterium ac157xtp]
MSTNQNKQRAKDENLSQSRKEQKQKCRTEFGDLGGVELKAPRRARRSFLDRFDLFDQIGSFYDLFLSIPIIKIASSFQTQSSRKTQQ